MAQTGVILPLSNLPIYPTISQFPVSAAANQLATALDTGDLYEFYNGSWTLLANPSGSGVTSLNALTGALTLVAGSGITITPSGFNITIASTVSGGITQLTGDVTAGPGSGSQAASLVATSNSTLTTLSGLTSASSLAIVGTVTSGTWHGTTIAIANGGTGQTSAGAAFNALSPITTTGDLILGTGANTAGRLGIGASNTSLTSNGTTASWNLLTNSNLSGTAAITNANLATMANNTVKANISGSTSTPIDTTATTTPSTASSFVVRDTNGNIDDFEPSYVSIIMEDFLGYQAASNNDFFQGAASGTGANTTPAGGSALVDIAHPGIAQMSTGTTTTGAASIWSGTEFTGGAGVITLEWLMFWPTLSNGTDTYNVVMGFADNFSATTSPTQGAWISYTDSVNSGNFVLHTGTGGVNSVNASSGPNAGAWNKFQVVFAADASLVTFYLNGVSLGTSNSHIPSSTAQVMNIYFNITKSAGTTNRALNIDYVKFKQVFTTPR